MRSVPVFRVFTLAIGALLASVSVAAAGQQPPLAPDQASQGPLVLQPIRPAGLIAPDVKVTRVNGGTGTLVGAYGGAMLEDTVLLGAGGYWLTQRTRGVNLGYGGFVAGWQTHLGPRISVGVKGLLGVGDSTFTSDVTILGASTMVRRDRDRIVIYPPIGRGFRFHQSFLVAEPDAHLTLWLGDRAGVTVAGGYRAIGAARGLERELRGATGSVSLQLKVGG